MLGAGGKKGGGGGGARSRFTHKFNQIHVSLILETAVFTNRVSFVAIFTCQGQVFHVSRINPLLPSEGVIRDWKFLGEEGVLKPKKFRDV